MALLRFDGGYVPGTGVTDWFDARNWFNQTGSPGTVPTGVDDVLIDSTINNPAVPLQAVLPVGPTGTTLRTLGLYGAAGAPGTLTLLGQLTATKGLTVGAGGVLNLDGPLSNTTLTIQAGGQVTTQNGTLDNDTLNGALAVGSGQTLFVNNALTLDAGSQLQLQAGGTLTIVSSLSIDGGTLVTSGGTIDTAYTGTNIVFGPALAWQQTSAGSTTINANSFTLQGHASLANGTVNLNAGFFTVSGSLALSNEIVNSTAFTVGLAGGTIAAGAGELYLAATAAKSDAGQVDIEADHLLLGFGLVSAANGIVDNGSIEAYGGTLRLDSAVVSGSGGLQVDRGATLSVAGGSILGTVTFAAAGGTLSIGAGTTLAGISGFDSSDQIIYGGALTGVLTGASVRAGVLTLTGPGGLAIRTQLTSTEAAGQWAVTAGANGTSIVTVAGLPNQDIFTWKTGLGTWSDPTKWTEPGGTSTPLAGPGAFNPVVIKTGFTTAAVVQGAGTSASLLVGGLVQLGAVTTGSYVDTSVVDSISVGSLTALRSAIQGTLTVNGNTSLGTLALEGSVVVNPHVTVTAGAVTTVAGAVAQLIANGTGASIQTGDIDARAAPISLRLNGSAGTIEVGQAGTVAAGTIQVDAGRQLIGSGLVQSTGAVIDNGTITAQGGTLSIDTLTTGTGQLAIAAGATLSVAGAMERISFAGPGATLLDVTNRSIGVLGALIGPIAGFNATDTIGVATVSQAVQGTTYRYNGDGTGVLTLNQAQGPGIAIHLEGDYTGRVFSVANTYNSFTGWFSNVTVDAGFAEGLFDPVYYLAHNPDVAASGADPLQQFLTIGVNQGRNPDAWFDTKYYLATNPDVKAAGVDPLLHFQTTGWKEGRQPSLAFSDKAYLAANPDVAAAGIDPLQHYLSFGQFEGRAAPINGPVLTASSVADPLVNAAYALGQVATIIPPTLDASAWEHTAGVKLGVNPDAWFDVGYYLAQNPDVKAAGVDPLLHFETNGWREGRDPSLVFSDAKYLAANPDVAAAKIDPLLHSISFGQAEGRMTFLSGGTAPADPLVNAAYYDPQLGATLIPTGTGAAQQAAANYHATGWQHGLNPDAFFNTAYYLSHNPDVAAAHVDPLLHYETTGWKEGRDPSAIFSTNKYLAAYADVKAAGLDPLLHYVANGQAEGRAIFHV